jgi:hypothetical protein
MQAHRGRWRDWRVRDRSGEWTCGGAEPDVTTESTSTPKADAWTATAWLVGKMVRYVFGRTAVSAP